MVLVNLRIISGGQTGVDRAALDVALDLGLKVGGYVPKGRRAEDGPLASKYPLTELATRDYEHRTQKNVAISDATLVLYRGAITPGSNLTVRVCAGLLRPCHTVDLAGPQGISLHMAGEWLADQIAKVSERPLALNIAGSRESSAPGIYEEAAAFLRALFRGVIGS